MSTPEGMAPETHNDEQDDERKQAQTVSQDAQQEKRRSPTDSRKGDNSSGLTGDSTQDTIDHMRDMESSGRVDMGAYRGEANHDDNVDKYGKKHKPDDLRGDGT